MLLISEVMHIVLLLLRCSLQVLHKIMAIPTSYTLAFVAAGHLRQVLNNFLNTFYPNVTRLRSGLCRPLSLIC